MQAIVLTHLDGIRKELLAAATASLPILGISKVRTVEHDFGVQRARLNKQHTVLELLVVIVVFTQEVVRDIVAFADIGEAESDASMPADSPSPEHGIWSYVSPQKSAPTSTTEAEVTSPLRQGWTADIICQMRYAGTRCMTH